MVYESFLDDGIMEFGYALVLGGGVSTFMSMLICSTFMYNKSPFITSIGTTRWETVMYNMYIGGSVVYFLHCINKMVYNTGDGSTVWMAIGAILLAVVMILMLVLESDKIAKAKQKNKQMMKDFEVWALKKGKTTNKGFNDLVNGVIDEVKPEMDGRMETPSYDDLKEFSQEFYPDFYKYLIEMEERFDDDDEEEI